MNTKKASGPHDRVTAYADITKTKGNHLAVQNVEVIDDAVAPSKLQ